MPMVKSPSLCAPHGFCPASAGEKAFSMAFLRDLPPGFAQAMSNYFFHACLFILYLTFSSSHTENQYILLPVSCRCWYCVVMPFSIFGIELKARCGSSSYIAKRAVIQHGVLQRSLQPQIPNSHPQIPSFAPSRIDASRVAGFGAPSQQQISVCHDFIVLRFSEQSEVKTSIE